MTIEHFSKWIETVLNNVDNSDTWMRICEQQVDLYKRELSMVLRNLFIVQHRDIVCYDIIKGEGYRPLGYYFLSKDYIYLQ